MEKENMYKIYRVTARSFSGRIPARHEFEITGKSKEEAFNAIRQRWPELYNIRIHRK